MLSFYTLKEDYLNKN